MNILAFLGIADAFADTAPAPTGGLQGMMSFLPMLVILILFMYFMVIRPQTKRAKEHRNLVSNLKKGDEVVTAGGILGKIDEISDDFITLTIAEKTNIKVQKGSVSGFVPKGTLKSNE